MGEAKRRKAERAGTPAPAALQYPGDDWNAASTPSVVAEKSCGSCTKCCTVMGVPELKKRPWDECPHVLAGRGCNIYADRPSGCRKFICGWLLDQHGTGFEAGKLPRRLLPEKRAEHHRHLRRQLSRCLAQAQ